MFQQKIFLRGGALALAFAVTPMVMPLAQASELSTPDYWQSQQADGDAVIKDDAGIKALNAQLRQKNQTLRDLTAYAATLSKGEVTAKVQNAAQNYNVTDLPTAFVDGRYLTQAEWDAVQDNRNLNALEDSVAVKYGVTTNRGNLRLLPSDTVWTNSTESSFDRLQGTAIDPAQAVAVLASSKDGRFYFVESSDYQGWLDSSKVALTDYKDWLHYAQPEKFLVVTSHKKDMLYPTGEDVLFQMGATIPLHTDEDGNAIMELPTRDNDGNLAVVDTFAPQDEDFHQGYLPYTKNTIITQAFKFLGDPYDWGGNTDSVDCSSYVQDIYRSMGILIPRDADQQELSMPVSSSNISAQTKLGSLVFKPGHVMMYLGRDEDGNNMVIHASSAYNQVMVARLADVTSNVTSVGSLE